MKRICLIGILVLLLSTISLADFVCVRQDIEINLSCPQRVKLDEDFVIEAKISPSGDYFVKGKILDETNSIVFDGVLGSYIKSIDVWQIRFSKINRPGKYKAVVYLPHPADMSLIEKSCIFSILPQMNVTIGLTSFVIYTTEDIVLETQIYPTSVIPKFTLEVYVNNIKITPSFQVLEKGGGKYNIVIKKNTITQTGDMKFKLIIEDMNGNYERWEGWKTGITYATPEIGVKIEAPISAKVNDVRVIKIITTDMQGNPIGVDNIEMNVRFPSGGTGETYTKKDFLSVKEGVYEMSYTFKYGQNYYFEVSVWKEGYKPGRAETNVAVSGGPVCGCDVNEDMCDEGCPCDPKCVKSQLPTFPIALAIVSGLIAFGLAFIRRR